MCVMREAVVVGCVRLNLMAADAHSVASCQGLSP